MPEINNPKIKKPNSGESLDVPEFGTEREWKYHQPGPGPKQVLLQKEGKKQN